MREQSNTEKDITPAIVIVAPWRLVKVKPLRHYRLAVEFVDGTRGVVDMAQQILGPTAGVFEKLRNPSVFDKAHLAYGAVTWPGGLDLAPDAMHSEIKAHGLWVLT